MELHGLLKYRKELAERATKDFIDDIKRSVDDYKLKDEEREKLEKLTNVTKRYEFRVPYIFATHDSMLASMFDRYPDIIFSGRGADDVEKEEKLVASYDYLMDKVDIGQFMDETAWWFLLCGWCSAYGVYYKETEDVPQFDEFGQVLVGEDGQPEMMSVFKYDDPKLYVGNPYKEYYSPECKFSNTGEGVPYVIREALMTAEEIKELYGKKVETDSTLDVDDLRDEKRDLDDIKRVKTYFYYGQIPKENRREVGEWESGADYYIVFTTNEILHKEKIDDKNYRFGRWYGVPNEFFGFGIGKTLREFQVELSVRRGQQIRYADLASHPKVAVDGSTEVDEKALNDPRINTVIVYRDRPPTYLTPPDLSETLIVTEEKAREDAQFVSGMLDLSKGAQQSKVVETATGQQIFAEAAERRLAKAKKQYGRFFRSVVIMLLKLAQKHWDEEKLISITDEQGNDKDVVVSKYDLEDIDFDKDIDIDMETISVNKEVLRAQAIELYDRVKDDPLVDRRMVFKKMLREGFEEKNPEQYIREEAEMMEDMGMPEGLGMSQSGQIQPSAEAGHQTIPTTQAGVLGNP